MPSLAARVARIAVPATLVGVTAIGVTAGVWGAKDAQIAYPAPVTSVSAASSAPSLTHGARGAGQSRPDRHPPDARREGDKKTKATSGKVKEVKLPTPALTVTGTKYATVGLNIRTVPTQNSKVITVVPTGTKLSITDFHLQGVPVRLLQGQGPLGEEPVPLGQEAEGKRCDVRAAASRPPRASWDPRSSPV